MSASWLFLFQSLEVLAVKIDPPTGTGKTIGENFSTFGSLVNVLVKNSLGIAGLILFVILLYVGIQLIINSGDGDPKVMAANQQILTTALIGFGIVFSATLIINIIEIITGVRITN